jgi:hypothetical protein
VFGRAGNRVLTIALQPRRSRFLGETLFLEDVKAIANLLRIQRVVFKLPKVVLVLPVGSVLERWLASLGLRLADLDRKRTETDGDTRYGLRSASNAGNGVSALTAR